MKKILTKEFGIGISVIVAIVILIFGIDYLKGKNLFSPANYYIAEYEDVAGLERSAPVVVNGFKVGQVREIAFDYANPGKIRVTLALDKDLHVPANSVASLGSTLLSGAFVNLTLGDSKTMLEKGGLIKSAKAQDLMASLQSETVPTVNSVLERVDSLVLNLNTLVGDPALLQSIRRLDGSSGKVMSATEGLNTTVNGQLPPLMANARHAVVRIDTIAGNLAALSADLRRLPLQSTMENVNSLTANLEKFSHRLNDQTSTLGQLTGDDELYRRLNSVTANIDSLIVDIKRNPKRYISIKLL